MCLLITLVINSLCMCCYATTWFIATGSAIALPMLFNTGHLTSLTANVITQLNTIIQHLLPQIATIIQNFSDSNGEQASFCPN